MEPPEYNVWIPIFSVHNGIHARYAIDSSILLYYTYEELLTDFYEDFYTAMSVINPGHAYAQDFYRLNLASYIQKLEWLQKDVEFFEFYYPVANIDVRLQSVKQQIISMQSLYRKLYAPYLQMDAMRIP